MRNAKVFLGVVGSVSLVVAAITTGDDWLSWAIAAIWAINYTIEVWE